MKKVLILLLILLLTPIAVFAYFSDNTDNNDTELPEEEAICTSNCVVGDKVMLKDGSYWHIISTLEDKTILFSDANIDLEGDYLPVNYLSYENTGHPVPFDVQNERTTENNPYCLYPDLGCSAYAKNDIDVFEDSSIKKIVDNKFLPKLKQLFNNLEINARLLTKSEFEYLQSLEFIKNKELTWIYHSAYWLMDSYNSYSVYLHKEETKTISNLAPFITYQAGIRPVIEIDTTLLQI